jgi:DNA invertase Pin-like site-specific DNA recombinase
MAKYGYGRVSSAGQQLNGNSLEEQEKTLREAGAEEITLECFTGTTVDRPKFTPLLRKLKSGDTLYVTKLDRFARAADAGKLIEELVSRGVTVNILNFGVANNSPTGKLMLNIIFSFAQYERDMIWERTQEGKMAARAKNPDYKEGRKALEIPSDYYWIRDDVINHGLTVKDACEKLGISRSTWYKWGKMEASWSN